MSKDGTIYVGSGVYDLEGGGFAGLFSFYTNGTLRSNLTTTGPGIPPSPIVGSNGIVYSADSAEGTYYGICDDGSVCMQYKIPNYNDTQYLSGIAMSLDGTIYFADGKYLYALGSNMS